MKVIIIIIIIIIITIIILLVRSPCIKKTVLRFSISLRETFFS